MGKRRVHKYCQGWQRCRWEPEVPLYEIAECSLQDPIVNKLFRLADQEFIRRYPERKGRRRGPLLSDLRILVAQRGWQAVGCCALQRGGVPTVADSYEVKRFYVVEKCRGTGVADGLMSSIGRLAESVGSRMLCFETGTRQPEAVHVALRHGYARIKPYPPYSDDPFALCFAKC
jgi:GNAT superfamily N-acetyltransferase